MFGRQKPLAMMAHKKCHVQQLNIEQQQLVHAANGIALFEDMVNSKSPMLSSSANKKHSMVYYRYIWFKTLWNQGRNGIVKEIEKELPNGCRNIPQNILFNKLEHEIC